MNVPIRSLVSKLGVAISLNENNLQMISKRLVFSDKYLKMDSYKEGRQIAQEKYSYTKETLKSYLLKQEESSLSDLNLSHIKKLLDLSTNPEDFKFLINLVKKSCLQTSCLLTRNVAPSCK